ncbi:MAG: hypothetical protein MUO63_11785 [Desulfobulbaceae bacterium]|nr:hypothetical protein [Desulfobulbaceae bacterium]
MPCAIFPPISYFTDNCFVLCPTLQQIERWPGRPLLILSSFEEKERGADVISRKLEKKGAEFVIFAQTNIHGTNMFGRVDGVAGRIVSWLSGKLQ